MNHAREDSTTRVYRGIFYVCISEKNKDQFKDILRYYLEDNLDSIQRLSKNAEWLSQNQISHDIFAPRECEFTIVEVEKTTDNTNDIWHFVNVANRKLEQLWLPLQSTYGALIQYFDTVLKKNKSAIRSASNMSPDNFDEIYADLDFQIQNIRDILVRKRVKDITKIKIYRETNPMRVLMMWNWVDGSCLSYYSDIGNYWSTATNALDANKAVFYIEDQNGDIIWRVLVAIDTRRKLVRFPVYKKWNINVDLNIYFNEYIKQFAEDFELWINGDEDDVDLIYWESWYVDPKEFIR